MIGLCVAMAQITFKMDQARRHGVTAAQVQKAIMLPELNDEDRQVALAAAWYVYQGNDDNGWSSAQLSKMVLRACMASQQPEKPRGHP